MVEWVGTRVIENGPTDNSDTDSCVDVVSLSVDSVQECLQLWLEVVSEGTVRLFHVDFSGDCDCEVAQD